MEIYKLKLKGYEIINEQINFKRRRYFFKYEEDF